MLSRRTFIIIIVAIALLASITAPPKSLTIKLLHSRFTSPYNTDWNGTSMFYESLVHAGYNVRILNNVYELVRTPANKILYIIIAPERKFNNEEVEIIRRTLDAKKLSIIIADENYGTANSIITPLFKARLAPVYILDINLNPIQTVLWELNGSTFNIRLNEASTFDKLGKLTPSLYSRPDSILLSLINNTILNIPPRPYPIVCFWASGDDFAIVISDSSLFINLYYNNTKLSDNAKFTQFLVDLATDGDKGYTVFIDNAHYNVIDLNNPIGSILKGFKMPIPPLGLICGIILSNLIKTVDYTFRRLLLSDNMFRMISLITFIVVIYYILSKRTGKAENDEAFYEFEEVLAIVETDIKRKLASPKAIKKEDYKFALASLYDVLRELFLRHTSMDISSLKSEDVEKLKSILNDDLQLALKTFGKLRKIKLNVEEGKFIFPPIIFWRRTFNNIVLASERIVKKFGASIVGEEGIKGVEYKLRRK